MAQITFKCAHCGSEQFDIPSNPKPDDVITCGGCGRTGKYSEVQKSARDKALKAAEDQAREAFRKAGFK